MSLPEGFEWGVATASYQIEGAASEDGKGPSIWDTFSHQPGTTWHGDHGDIACDHYHRMPEDVNLLADLGVSVYRFSISWPRIQPTGRGRINHAGLDFYKRLLDNLEKNGIKAAVTLYHWDLPQALQDEGGWEVPETAQYFAEYAEAVGRELSGRVFQWITLNEPWCSSWLGYGVGVHAPGIRDFTAACKATHQLLLAHGMAVQALRSVDRAPVGIVLNPHVVRPASPSEDDVAAARRVEAQRNELWLEPLFFGRYPEELAHWYAKHWRGFLDAEPSELQTIAAPIDFLGVNYYSSAIVQAYSGPVAPGDYLADLQAHEIPPAFRDATPMGWRTDPDAFAELLTHLHKEYSTPIYVTENGRAAYDYVDPEGSVRDLERIDYLSRHITALQTAVEAGADIRGYYIWSFMDNLEWAHGFAMRFGLVFIDYRTQERIPKASFRFYQDVIDRNGL